jgi:HEPN domain-containing protein
MNSQKKLQIWLDKAKYDLETAEAMFNAERWLYVSVMCQQTIERLVKGLYTFYIDDNVPRSHNITKIIKQFENQFSSPIFQDRLKFFDQLSIFYLEDRYEVEIENMNELFNKEQARKILLETKEAYKWLLSLII